jgi:hypothetical protein
VSFPLDVLPARGRVGSRRDCTWILGLSGFRVESIEGEDAATSRLRIRIERRGRAIRAAGGADGLYENVSVLAAAAGSAAAES